MDLRGRITEELDNMKFEKLLTMTYAIMVSMNKDQDFDERTLEEVVAKAFKQLGISQFSQEGLYDKVVACFELSPTFKIQSPDFNRNPPLKKYKLNVSATWSGYGTDYFEGEMTAYTQRELKRKVYDGDYPNYLEMYDRDFKGYDVDEIDINDLELVSDSINEDKIKGGLSDKMSLKDIAKKHDTTEKELQKQLDKGIEVEMEHTDKKSVAKEIAMDHLFEDPKYYDKLGKMEGKDFDRVALYLEYYQNLTPDEFKVKRKGNEIIITLPEGRKS